MSFLDTLLRSAKYFSCFFLLIQPTFFHYLFRSFLLFWLLSYERLLGDRLPFCCIFAFFTPTIWDCATGRGVNTEIFIFYFTILLFIFHFLSTPYFWVLFFWKCLCIINCVGLEGVLWTISQKKLFVVLSWIINWMQLNNMTETEVLRVIH